MYTLIVFDFDILYSTCIFGVLLI
ncbi:hypothetical protein ACQ27_gp263 [Klebsiella phage K64-1]|nr:hypothetical protein ACQ27_gp263 [Klebsiella phage K64-1]